MQPSNGPASRAVMSAVSFLFAGEQLVPQACGALWWPARRALLVADLHLEKASWLAGTGQLLPPWDSIDTLDRLASAVGRLKPAQLIALGDSFHDRDGPGRLPPRAAATLQELMRQLHWLWVGGNHEGLSGGRLGGSVADEYQLGEIILRHEARKDELRPEISGHWHPKARIALRTGRRITKRCFAAAPRKLVLPAYGALTGGLSIGDPAIRAAMRGPVTGLVPTNAGLLRVAAGPDRP